MGWVGWVDGMGWDGMGWRDRCVHGMDIWHGWLGGWIGTGKK